MGVVLRNNLKQHIVNKKTYYQLILDRSGSMSSCIEQTVEGVNNQIHRIKEVADKFPEQELITSLTFFNHEVTPVWIRKNIEELTELSYTDYRPDGTTSLFDAIGISIKSLQDSIGKVVEENLASVVVVIITDGYENSSTSYKLKQIKGIIEELEKTGKWNFSYIGTTLDTYQVACTLSIKRGNTMLYDLKETSSMYHKLSNNIVNYMKSKDSGIIESEFLANEDDDE